MSVAPPSATEHRLTALVPRVRALRVARGTCGLVVAALAAIAAVVLTDAAFPLPAWTRGLYLSVWVTAVGVLAWRWVLVPWRAEISPAEVARELEKAPTQTLPVKPVAWFAAGAVAAVFAVGATAALVPGSGERLRRVAAPWSRPNGAPAFRVVVTSGEPVVRRGGPVTLSAYAERATAGDAALPEAVLVTRDGPDAPKTRAPMTGDGAAFHATRSCVHADFEYRVELGTARSEWFRVTVLDAVELAPGTAIEIVPPEYATGVPRRTLAALTDLDGLQFGTAVFRLKFTQPAASGHLDWRPNGDPKSEWIALEFAPDRTSATAVFPLRGDGTLRLVLVREADGKRLRADTTVAVRAVADEPPRFEELSGVTPRQRTVHPRSIVPIAFVALDDLNVAGAELQYVIGSDETKRVSVPIPLTGAGTPRASGRFDFNLGDKAGDVIRFRIVVTDNRNAGVDKAFGPQVAIFPRTGWSELRLSVTAPPLDEQNAVCACDELHDALAGASKALTEAAAEATAIDAATAGSAALALDQAVQLNNARDKVRSALDALRDAARDAALAPELRPLAAAVRATEQKARPAEDALRRAETDAPAVRAEALAGALAHLRAAGATLDELAAQSARLARARLDRLRVAALAADQMALADDIKPGAPGPLARQRVLLARLVALLAESPPLRAAHNGAKAEEVRQFAVALSELTARLRELDDAAKRTTADTRAALVAAIARDQDALAKRAAALFAKLDTAARLTGVALPRPDDFPRAAELAAAGKTVEALTEIERHSLALDRLAAAFEKWAAERADPRTGAKQLAQWQDDVLARVRAAPKPGGFAALPDETKAVLRAEQKALAAAAEALSLPPDESVRAARAGAVLHTGAARDFLARDGAGAEDAMKAAVRALGQLIERTPPAAERLTRSQRELEKLRQDFETSAIAVDLTLRGFDRQQPDATVCAALAKKLAPQVEKLRRLGTAVGALDLPGLGERQTRVVFAIRTAVSDLQDGPPFDVQASQLWVRRELERLKLVLEGLPPPDAKAEELHRKLAAAADAIEAHGPNLTLRLTDPALPVVQAASHQLALIAATDAPALSNDARAALQSAEIAFREAKTAEIRRRVRAAADALGRLSERLNGFESDFDRVTRLAALRRAGAERPKELLTSDEAVRQIGREADELANTRVGAGGQVAKKRAVDLYAKLRAKADPDRVGTDLKALTTALDELAAKMADVAELTTGAASASAAPTDADEFLPSKPLTDALRELEKRQRRLHTQVTNLAADLTSRLRPSATNPFAPVEAAQRAIVRDALTLAREFDTDPANKAASASTRAADHIRVGLAGPAKEEAGHAANFFRQLATAGGDKPRGKRAAALAARQDAVLAELAALLDRPDAAVAQQVARANELARTAGEVAARLALAAESLDPNDPTHKALAAAALTMKGTEKGLTEVARKASTGSAADADKLRASAGESLGAASEAIPSPPPGAPGGEWLRVAERSMRKTVAELAAGNTVGAQKAAREAAQALREGSEREPPK